MNNEQLTEAVDRINTKLSEIERQISVNNEQTSGINKDLKELLHVFNALKTLLEIANEFSRVVKWISFTSASVAAAYYTITHAWDTWLSHK